MLLVRLGTAILLPDGQGRETGDELILPFHDPKNPVLMGQCRHGTVEGTSHGGQGVDITGSHHIVHFPQAGTETGNILGGGVANDGRQGQHFQCIADGVDFFHIGNGKRPHHHAPANLILHQTVPLQFAQCLPQRRPADMQPLRIVGFHNAFAGRDFSADNGVLEDFIGDLTNGSAFHHGLELQGIHAGSHS